MQTKKLLHTYIHTYHIHTHVVICCVRWKFYLQKHANKKVDFIHYSLCLAPIWSLFFWDTLRTSRRALINGHLFCVLSNHKSNLKSPTYRIWISRKFSNFYPPCSHFSFGQSSCRWTAQILSAPSYCVCVLSVLLYLEFTHIYSQLFFRCCPSLSPYEESLFFLEIHSSLSMKFRHICFWCHGEVVRALCAFSQLSKPLNIMSLLTTSN